MRNFVLFGVLFLAGCAAPVQQEYVAQNYVTQSGTEPFAEAKATCRAAYLQHNAVWDTNTLDKPEFTACMARHGYAYNGPAL